MTQRTNPTNDSDRVFRELKVMVARIRCPSQDSAGVIDARNSCVTMVASDSDWAKSCVLRYRIDANIHDVHIEVFLVANFRREEMQQFYR